MNLVHHRLAAFCVLTMLAAPAWAHSQGLSAADRTAIEGVHDAFRTAWLRNDAEAVMRLLTDDAVIMPHHGVRPRAGSAAIRAFWWPTNSAPAKVVRFEQAADEIGGDGNIAFLRGRSTVEYDWAPQSAVHRFRNMGTTLTLFRRVGRNDWKISHRMWDDPPTEDLGPVGELEGRKEAAATGPAASDQDIARVADEYVAAYEALDAARMGRLLAEDVQFEDPTFRLKETSRAAMMKMVEGAAAGFEGVEIEVRDRIIRPPHAVLHVTFVGKPRAKAGAPAREPIRVRGVTILRVEDGVIRQWTDYFDFRTFAEAMKMRVCSAPGS
jgi:uncharacterized protein (TIGR02246 family)